MIAKILERISLFFEKPLPELPTEVDWEDYIRKLEDNDRHNVEEVCRRLLFLSKEIILPLSIMAVGSVLNKKRDYNDIDLAIFPLNGHNLEMVEEILATFITNQPEVVKKSSSHQMEVKERKWWNLHMYDLCRYWELRFPKGKPIQLFICTSFRKMTLREKLEMEANEASFFNRKFAYLILNHQDQQD